MKFFFLCEELPDEECEKADGGTKVDYAEVKASLVWAAASEEKNG